MNDIFSKLDELEKKLNNMDSMVDKIDQLGQKIEDAKPPTAQEKLELRSLDSYPFNENPKSFFDHKLDQMKKSKKNEYVLTKDDVQNYSRPDMIDSFNPEDEDEDKFKFYRD